MDVFERCVAAAGDPRLCSFAFQVGVAGLAECLEVRDAGSCYRACLEGCPGDGCEEACLVAAEVALGVVVARRVARRAAAVAERRGLDPLDAVALIFDGEVRKAGAADCLERGAAALVLVVAAVELYAGFRGVPDLRGRAQDVLLLAAPALATAYPCVGEEVFEYLELVRPFVGEEAVGRVVAAVEEGSVLVGSTLVRFEPVKAAER
jgi:hypothetical protein